MPAATRLRKSLFPAVAAAFLTLLLTSAQSHAQDYYREELRIPFPGVKGRGLEAVLIRPAGKGPHPLALLSHGTPATAAERRKMGPNEFYRQSIELARRGFAALAVMRRGYGDSEPGYAETPISCGPNSTYLAQLKESVTDLKAAIAAMRQRSDVTLEGMIALGQSAGGLATIALTTDPPRELTAAINFAGGRKPSKACGDDKIVSTFRALGRTSRIPMLWFYSENDSYFGPDLARRFHQAFTASGGKVEFIAAPKSGSDGHFFISNAIDQWTPTLDKYLASRGIARQLLPPPKLASLPPPSQLAQRAHAEFRRYLAGGLHRAFAISSNGAYGFQTGLRTPAAARAAALETCAKHASDCKIYAVDDTLEIAL
jgi:dienelactone hydrolase